VFLNRAHQWVVDSDQLAGVLAMRAPTPQALEQALALFRDEPLPENRYDDWATRVRNRLQRLHRDASFRLIRAYTENGELERAREHAESLLDEDPLDEEAEQVLLVVLAALGLRVEALRRYSHFVQRLQAEMGVAPDRRLQVLAQTLRADLNAV
jgi:DNA-binding SARP family transcriptional activator